MKKEYKGAKRKAIIFDGDRKILAQRNVLSEERGVIETVDGVYPAEEARVFYDEQEEVLTYVFGIDTDSKVEAETLRDLRRNVLLSRLFDYKQDKPFDIIAFLPWIVIILLIFFK